MWNLNKTRIFLPKTCGNCLPGWRGVLEETRPAPGPKPCLERSVAQLQKLLFVGELSSCASKYTALTYFTRHTHQFYTGVSPWHQCDYSIPALGKTQASGRFTKEEDALVTYIVAQTPLQETKFGSFYTSKYFSSRGFQHQASMLPPQCLLHKDPSHQVTEVQCPMYLCDTSTSESALKWGLLGWEVNAGKARETHQEQGQWLVCSTMWPSHLVPSWSVPAGQCQGPTRVSLWGPHMKQGRENSSTGLLVSAVLYGLSCFCLQIELFSPFSLFCFLSSVFPHCLFSCTGLSFCSGCSLSLWLFRFFAAPFSPAPLLVLPDITKVARVFFLLSSLTKFLSSIFHCFRISFYTLSPFIPFTPLCQWASSASPLAISYGDAGSQASRASGTR